MIILKCIPLLLFMSIISCSKSISAFPSDGIYEAINTNDIKKINELIKTKPELVNYQDNHIVSPLWYAISKSRIDIAKILIEHGADTQFKAPNSGFSVKQLAISNNLPTTFIEMLETRHDN